MEESNLINNDNTYNTDMSTSQSTIGENATTNDKFNKDDLQEVTGGGGGGTVTPPTTIVDGSETSQTTGTLTPILLILGDGTSTDEEPVLLEEDGDTTYNAVLNQSYENKDPTITLESGEVSYCDANYVIAVTESDKNTPISYNSNNLSFSFTNNGNKWCSVEFKNPLEVTDQLKLPLNSTNFPSNSNIIVPVITCQANTGSERNTTITFNIKNFDISHNIQMNVIQDGVTFVDGPCVLRYTSTDSQGKYNYEILNNPVYYITSKSSFVFMNTNLSEHMLLFGLNKNNNIVGNLTQSLEYYNTLFSADDNNYKCKINDNAAYAATKGTAAYMTITQPENKDLNQTITFKYNNITFMKVKYMDNIKYKTTIYICTLENLQNYKTDEGYIIYLFNSDIGISAAIKDTISYSKIVPLRGDNNTDISNGRIVTCWREYYGSYDTIKADNIGELNNYTSDDETFYQIIPVQAKANLSAKDLGSTYNNVYIEDWTGLKVYDYNSSTLNFKGLKKNTDIYVYTIKDNKYVKIGVINFGKELNQNNYIGNYDYYYQSFQASTYNSYWFQYIHCYGDKNDSYYNSEIETDALNSTFKDKQFGTFDLYFVVIYNIYENNKTDVDIANSIINSGKTYKKYQVPSGTYQFTMNNLIALTYHPKDIQVETIKTFSVLYNELNLTKSHYSGNNFYNKYNTYNVIDLNNVCNDINGNIINLNEVCKDLGNRIYIFTKENTKLVYIGVISPAHAMTDVIMANFNHYT